MSSLPYSSGPSRRQPWLRTWPAAAAALLALSATAFAQDDTGGVPAPAIPAPAAAPANTTAAPAPTPAPAPAFSLPAPVRLRLPAPNGAPAPAAPSASTITAPRPSSIPAPTGVPAPVVTPQAAAPASVPPPSITAPAVQYTPVAPATPAPQATASANVTPPPNPAPGIATPINPPPPQNNNAFAPRPQFGGPNPGFGGGNGGFGGGRPGFGGPQGAPQGAPNVPGAPATAQNTTTIVKADPAMVQATALLNGVADPNVPVTVNFTDEVAPQIVSWLAKYTDKIILQSQALPATRLNFTSNHDIPLAEAVFALQSLLNMNGVAIIPMSGNIFRAVPNNDMTTQTPTLLTDGIEQLPGNENVYSRFFSLNYITSDDAVRLLTPFMSPRISALISFERSNSIFVTDNLLNLQRIAEILKKADVESDMQEDTLYIQLHNAKSSDVMGHLTRLQQGPLRKYIGTNTAFEADDRTNTIIVVTPKSEDDLIKKIVTSLDADVDPTTRAELFKIKQAVSATVVQLLQQIVTGQQQNNQSKPTTTANNSPASTSNPVNGGTPPPAPVAPAAPAGGRAGAAAAAANDAARDQQFSPYVTIVSDDRSNSIVVYGTASDIRQLGDLINKVDVILPQVRIEAVITEVTLTKGQVSGLSSFGLSYHFLPGNSTTGTAGSAGGSRDVNITTGTNAPPNSSTPAFTFSGSLTNFGLDTVFNIASTNDKVKVLSAPNITTTHNSQATIQVTENYPIVTSTTTQIQNAAAVGNNVTQTVTYSQIGITLQVQPLIGDNGVIQMNITQNDENIISFIPVNGIEQPIIGQRQATSFISVKDGEVIVLGGLQQTNHNVEHDKVFFLGDLPLIGQLFQPTTYSDSTSELIIFIKPTIIHSSSAADIIAKETVSNSLASKSVADYLKTGVVAPPADPDLSTPPSKQSAPPPGLNK